MSDDPYDLDQRAPWVEYRRLVLAALKRGELERCSMAKSMRQEFIEVRAEIAELKSAVAATERERKIIATLFGLFGGVAGVAVPVILWMLTRVVL